jgi:hypothetical protein
MKEYHSYVTCVYFEPQPIENRLFLAGLLSLNWHRSSQTAVLLVEVEILAHLDEEPCRGHSSKRHLLWKLGNSVSQWQLTQGSTSFCALLNLPFWCQWGPVWLYNTAVSFQQSGPHFIASRLQLNQLCCSVDFFRYIWVTRDCFVLRLCAAVMRAFLFLYPLTCRKQDSSKYVSFETVNQLIWKFIFWNMGQVLQTS